MKKNEITVETVQLEPQLEALMLSTHTRLKSLAEKDAEHFGKQNLPAPENDSLLPYIEGIKGAYEHLAAEVLSRLQPSRQFPEAKSDADHARSQERQIEGVIKEKDDQNRRDEYKIHDYHPGSIPLRVFIAFILSLIICTGESAYTMKALQIIVESLVLALALSITVSIIATVGSHIAAFMFKGYKSKIKKMMVILFSLAVMTIVFGALAIIRSEYLGKHDVHINPFYFIVFNLFFFTVSFLTSLYILPTWTEIKEQMNQLKLYYAVKKRKGDINKLKQQAAEIRQIAHEKIKERGRIVYTAKYVVNKIHKMYYEAVGIFKSKNKVIRMDKKTPTCSMQETPPLNIEDISVTIISQNDKLE